MTRKDYEKFARIIKERRVSNKSIGGCREDEIEAIIQVCCKAFKEDNERFNEQKFVEATALNETVRCRGQDCFIM